jgi:hypothetical protein
MEDVEELIEEARALLTKVGELSELSAAEGKPIRRIRVQIKSLLEHQRSILDYLVEVVNGHFKTSPPPKGKHVYYPFAWKPGSFEKVFDGCMPGVRLSHPEVAAAFARHQPLEPEGDWIQWLVELVNENKHRILSAQARIEFPEYRAPGGTSVKMLGNSKFRRRGGPGEPEWVETQDPTGIIVGSGPWTRTTGVDWFFAKPSLMPATAILASVQNGVEMTVADIRVAAGL